MGYDTEKPSFYWKDTVAAELNVAIVQSYQVCDSWLDLAGNEIDRLREIENWLSHYTPLLLGWWSDYSWSSHSFWVLHKAHGQRDEG